MSEPARPTRTRYGYFVLQASATQQGEATALTGVLEDLSTGAKRQFESAEDITRLLVAWAEEASASGTTGAP